MEERKRTYWLLCLSLWIVYNICSKTRRTNVERRMEKAFWIENIKVDKYLCVSAQCSKLVSLPHQGLICLFRFLYFGPRKLMLCHFPLLCCYSQVVSRVLKKHSLKIELVHNIFITKLKSN